MQAAGDATRHAVAFPLAELGTSTAAIRAHYDLDSRFFSLFLDASLGYSGGMWRHDDAAADGDTIEAAQDRKVDWFADQLDVTRDAFLLDIGCGWGGPLARLVGEHGVERAVGLTPSPSVGYARARADAPITDLVRNEIFPRSSPPHLSELVVAWEPYFAVRLIRGDAAHHARTFGAWLERLTAQRPAVERLVGADGFHETWKYLAGVQALFRPRGRPGRSRTVMPRDETGGGPGRARCLARLAVPERRTRRSGGHRPSHEPRVPRRVLGRPSCSAPSQSPPGHPRSAGSCGERLARFTEALPPLHRHGSSSEATNVQRRTGVAVPPRFAGVVKLCEAEGSATPAADRHLQVKESGGG